MSNDKKTTNKKPKFSPYWVYGIIIVIFLAINVFSGFGSSSGNLTTPAEFFKYLKDGDVDKVQIVNRREAKIYLTDEALRKEIHKKAIKPQFLPISGKSPNYQFEFALKLFDLLASESYQSQS